MKKTLFNVMVMLAAAIAIVSCSKDDVAVTGVKLSNTTATIEVDSTVQLSYTYEPTDAKIESAVWSSSADAVATVDQNGVVKGVAAGAATITITVNGKFTATCAVTVEAVDPSVTTVAKVVSNSGKYTFAYSITKNKYTSKVRYIVSLVKEIADFSDNQLITYIGKYGKETTEDIPETEISSGTTLTKLTVAAIPYDSKGNAGALSKSIVTPEAPSVTGITISSEAETIKVDSTVQLSYTVEPTGAKVESAVWSSSADAVATVDQKGVVKGIAEGTATITITVNDTFTKTCAVTVEKSGNTNDMPVDGEFNF